jgi:spermidine/putrescine-binding protein
MDALLADGVAPEDLTPFDLDRAFAKLDKIKTSITVYWETGNQLVSSLADKRVVMCLCIDGRALQAGQLNPDIEVAWDGGLRYVGYWVVPTNAPHPEAAHAFLKSTLDPDRGATFTSLIGYSGIVKGVYDLLTPERQKNVLINPKNLDKTYELTPDQVKWIGDHYDEINERWTTWVSQ